jgi:hypothetical protein
MQKVDGLALYKKMKGSSKIQYKEEIHCPMIIDVMANPNKGSYSAFCVEAGIGEANFYIWLNKHAIFKECYGIGKMFAKENWEKQGLEIAEHVNMPGTSTHKFEYWRMIGWARFGIGKNSRIRLAIDPKSNPSEHYGQLIQQASEGDFTAGEIKQLMEAVNVGLNTHQVFTLQKEIDQLKFDLTVMNENNNGDNTFADKRPKKKD